MLYGTIEDLICDEKIPPKIRVSILNEYEVFINTTTNYSRLCNSFGRGSIEPDLQEYAMNVVSAMAKQYIQK